MSAISAIAAETIFDLEYERCLALGRNSGQSVRNENFESRRVELPLDPANDLPCEIAKLQSLKGSHSSVPSSHPQHATERAVPQLAQNPQTLRERLHAAMKRRVGPGKGLTVKMVANATGLTERTVENSMSGSTMPRSDTLHTLMCFFDASFCNEVFAGANFMVVKLTDRRAAEAARMINDGIAILQAAGRNA